VNERTVVVGLIGHCVSLPPTVERDRRAWLVRWHSGA